MKRKRYKDFLHLVRFMKSSLKTQYPFCVRRTRTPKDNDGDCEFRDDHYIIRINKNLPEFYAIEVLLHELGHTLSWTADTAEAHGPAWGKAYSVVYRKFLEWIDILQASR